MNALPPTAPAELSSRRAWAFALLIACALFAAIAPTLSWTQFTNGNENIVVQTALEMRHGGPKLLPQLMGEPRVKKPPLVTWLTAASMRPTTLAKLDDLAARDDAYRELSFQTRWPALLAGCVMLLATFEFARVWGGGGVAMAAAMAVGTNYLFIKYLRQSTTDAHLAAWVAVANACFIHGLLRGRWAMAAPLGGLAVGVAFLCKGPVALVETVLPTIVAAAVLHAGRSRDDVSADVVAGIVVAEPKRSRAFPLVPVVLGVLLFAAVAVPWFAYVLHAVPGVAATWKTEVGREGATNLDTSNPAGYLMLGFMTAPWVVFGLAGLLLLWQRRGERAAWLPFIFAVVPLLVMVWFRDRKERYMLPMIGPAAVICGYGVATWAKSWRGRRTWGDVGVVATHTVVMLAMVAGLLYAGTKVLKRVDGAAWFPPAIALWGGVATLAIVALVGLLLRRGRAWAVPAASFVVVLGVNALYFHGYGQSEGGRSPLKPISDAIRTQVPNAAVYDWLPRGRADEQLALYLNSTILRADPATLTPIDRPLVVIARQAKQDAPPQLPAEWRLLVTAKEGAATWFAYVRRAESTPP